DGRGAVKLLGEHDADKLVRPGEPAKGKDEVGVAMERGIVAIRAADGEDQVLAAGFAEAGNRAGEFFRANILAALVEQDKRGCAVLAGEKSLAFFASAFIDGGGPAFRGFR